METVGTSSDIVNTPSPSLSPSSDYKKHPTNTKWIVWYHNPSDKSWGLDSYKDIIEISSIEDFWVLKNSWEKCLPNVYEGMFFVMRKTPKTCIYPQWEDKHNRKGGYWSFKTEKAKSSDAWFSLMMHTLGEWILKDKNDANLINGISISPKKHFCIIKIWNADSKQHQNTLLSPDLSSFLNIEGVLYSNHEDNIKKDENKYKKRDRYNSGGKSGGFHSRYNSGSNHSGSNGRSSGRRDRYRY